MTPCGTATRVMPVGVLKARCAVGLAAGALVGAEEAEELVADGCGAPVLGATDPAAPDGLGDTKPFFPPASPHPAALSVVRADSTEKPNPLRACRRSKVDATTRR